MQAIPVDQPATPSQRGTRLLAVMMADVVDYTRLTEVAELETHTRLRALRVETIDPVYRFLPRPNYKEYRRRIPGIV